MYLYPTNFVLEKKKCQATTITTCHLSNILLIITLIASYITLTCRLKTVIVEREEKADSKQAIYLCVYAPNHKSCIRAASVGCITGPRYYRVVHTSSTSLYFRDHRNISKNLHQIQFQRASVYFRPQWHPSRSMVENRSINWHYKTYATGKTSLYIQQEKLYSDQSRTFSYSRSRPKASVTPADAAHHTITEDDI